MAKFFSKDARIEFNEGEVKPNEESVSRMKEFKKLVVSEEVTATFQYDRTVYNQEVYNEIIRAREELQRLYPTMESVIQGIRDGTIGCSDPNISKEELIRLLKEKM